MPVGVSAYVPLATKTLTATATSVTFSSISQAYRDLVLVVQATGGDGGDIRVSINGDLYYNHVAVIMYGTGTATGSGTGTDFFGSGYGLKPSNVTQIKVDFMDYSTTNKHKTSLFRIDTPQLSYGGYGTTAGATRWPNTAAITSIAFSTNTNFAIGSTFTLYGIASV